MKTTAVTKAQMCLGTLRPWHLRATPTASEQPTG